ncbi:hypothetical protein [Dactylosporangium sp. CS-033363]|uniref:hypothetical protein n=1 Tax=Dactylosporangium sp. CS-033363 TaxID=3239935 RepID=UPI003D92E2F7
MSVFSVAGGEVWNESCDLSLRMSREGESVADGVPAGLRHLAYLNWFNNRFMSSGLGEALEWHPVERMQKVADACDYLGLTGLGALIRDLAAEHDNVELAGNRSGAYWDFVGRRPEDDRIGAAMEERLRIAPEDFGRGDPTR